VFTLRTLIVSCLLALTIGAAKATTYDFVGPAYNCDQQCSGFVYDPALGNNITGSVTFDIDTSNFSGQISTVLFGGLQATALTMTAGSYSLSLAQNELYGLFSLTNGQITSWSVCGNAVPGGCDGTPSKPVAVAGDGLLYLGVSGSTSNPPDGGETVEETAVYCTPSPPIGCSNYGARRAILLDIDNSGSWTELQLRTAPLPAALPLFAGGLGLIGIIGRRRRKAARALAAA
jgi:hypothetical protein